MIKKNESDEYEYYEGEWVRGIKKGNGVYKFFNDDRYEGEFDEDQFNGKGKLIFTSGDLYEGDWRNNKMEGVGLFTSKD